MQSQYNAVLNILAGASGFAGLPSLVTGFPVSAGSGGIAALSGSKEMIESFTYIINTGALVNGGVISFQELGADGNWRTLSSPVPVSINQASMVFTPNAPIAGPFHGVRMNLTTALSGGNITYAELKSISRRT